MARALFDFSNSSVANTGFAVLENATVTGVKGTSEDITANLIQAFSSSTAGNYTTGGPFYDDFNETCLDRVWTLASGAVGIVRWEDCTPGASYLFRYMAPNSTNTRPLRVADGATTVDVTSVGGTGQNPPEAPTEITSVADGSGHITHTYSIVSISALLSAVTVEPAAVAVAPIISSPTTIATVGGTTATTGVTTDTASGTLYTITTVNPGVPSGAQIKAGTNASGSAATFSGSQVVSSTGAKTFSNTGLTASTTYYSHSVHENSAGFSNVTTKSFVTRTTTHTIAVPAAANVGGAGVDSKSALANQGWLAADEPVYINSPALPVDWTWIDPVTGWADAPLEQDVNDYIQPPVGFTGSEIITFGRQYADATIVPWDVTLNVDNGVISVGQRSFNIGFAIGF